jgi:hypothetical protein
MASPHTDRLSLKNNTFTAKKNDQAMKFFMLALCLFLPATRVLADSCDQTVLLSSPTQRLSSRDYSEAIRSIFGRFIAEDRLRSILAAIPSDNQRGGPVFEQMKQNLSFDLIQGYAQAAENLSEELRKREDWFDEVLGESACKSSLNQRCIDNFFWNIGRPLYRRQLTDAEKTRYSRFTESEAGDGRQKVLMMTQSLLQAPAFIFREERAGTETTDGLFSLTEYELAARLAAFLWRSAPDKQLLDRAWQGQLRRNWDEEVARMMQDPRFESMLDHFYSSWLNLDFMPAANYSDSFLDGMQLNKDSYLPELRRELLSFTRYITQNDFYFADLVSSRKVRADSDFLARLYGTSRQSDFQEMETRPGILSRAGLLANGLDYASIVKRGLWINSRILCRDIPPPPDPTVIANPPRPNPTASSRQQLEARTGQGFCVSCHKSINPPGFVLEQFDALGRFRTEEKVITDSGIFIHPLDTRLTSANIDSSADPAANNIQDYTEILARSPRAHQCFVEHWYMYTFARKPTTPERCFINEFATKMQSKDMSIRQMIREMTRHPFFHYAKTR